MDFIMKYDILFLLSTLYVMGYINRCHLTEVSDHRCNGEPVACPGPNILSENNGRIISHNWFKRKAYSNNTSCTWIVRAPKGYLISLQITFLSIELSLDCVNDHLSFYDGYQITESTRIGRFCGSVIRYKIISLSNVMSITFNTNEEINEMGFQMRYTFYQLLNIATSLNDLISISMFSSSCGILEVQCPRSRECIARSWLCDGIFDCRDRSDEMHCNRKTCTSSSVRCSQDCIPEERFCGNISQCVEIKDKIFPTNDTDEITIESSGRDGCSRQPIPNTEMRVVGGVIARKGSWPWQVLLRSLDGILCGGSIINAQWVLTAAHCFEGRSSAQLWSVFAGRFKLEGNEDTAQTFRARTVVRHERYTFQNNDNDIAMIQIDGNFVFNNYVQPICLGVSVPPAGTSCYITGWGVTQGTGGWGYLKQAKVPTVDKGTCQSWYSNILTDSMLCAGYESGGVDSCQGDSGGPLACKINSKYQLIGITSWGMGCAQPRTPGIYTAVPLFSQWIANVLGTN